MPKKSLNIWAILNVYLLQRLFKNIRNWSHWAHHACFILPSLALPSEEVSSSLTLSCHGKECSQLCAFRLLKFTEASVGSLIKVLTLTHSLSLSLSLSLSRVLHFNQRTLTYFVSGNIAVRLTSCLTG